VPEKTSFDYAIVRFVPRVERQEFLNVGVIVFCREHDFLKASVAVDDKRLAAFAPTVAGVEIDKHLTAIERICAGGKQAGPIGLLPPQARFCWLTAPRSTIIQTSPVHSGLCDDPDAVLARLYQTMVHNE